MHMLMQIADCRLHMGIGNAANGNGPKEEKGKLACLSSRQALPSRPVLSCLVSKILVVVVEMVELEVGGAPAVGFRQTGIGSGQVPRYRDTSSYGEA